MKTNAARISHTALLYCCLAAIFFALTAVYAASGNYKVETDDNEYVSAKFFFSPVSTWDKIDARVINLNKGRMIFYADRDNEPQRIEASVMPVNATDKRLSFRSEDMSVATVTEDGIVMPMNKVGNTVIDIRCGNAKAKMKVSVVRGVEGVAMSQSGMTLYADRPVEAQLEAFVAPADATIRDVTWESEDDSIVYVDKDGVVYPCGVGTANVYARTVDGGFITKCAVNVTTWETRKEDIPVVYTSYDITLEEMVRRQMDTNPTVFTSNAYPAYESEVLAFADPENLISGYDRYQFMDLGSSCSVDEDTLDAYLNGKGTLSGMGRIFKETAQANDLNEIYLVIHACLESGNGTSELARGVEYNGVTVYNMYGIGAIDSAPVSGGAKYAYEQGWTSVEKAIEGGAEWISDNYINNIKYRQNTLYKMRWNPDDPAVHQYASDVEWASKQARNMGAMFEAFPQADYRFEVPQYKQ